MLRDRTGADSFTEFVRRVEPGLRRALTAGFGDEVGREATAEALAYGWEHWERVGGMDNPAGYLYRVGRDKARRAKRPTTKLGQQAGSSAEVWAEPGLNGALDGLSERQRVVVSLLHAWDWSMSEVAELLGVSKSTVQSYEARAMRKLERALGVGS